MGDRLTVSVSDQWSICFVDSAKSAPLLSRSRQSHHGRSLHALSQLPGNAEGTKMTLSDPVDLVFSFLLLYSVHITVYSLGVRSCLRLRGLQDRGPPSPNEFVSGKQRRHWYWVERHESTCTSCPLLKRCEAAFRSGELRSPAVKALLLVPSCHPAPLVSIPVLRARQ